MKSTFSVPAFRSLAMDLRVFPMTSCSVNPESLVNAALTEEISPLRSWMEMANGEVSKRDLYRSTESFSDLSICARSEMSVTTPRIEVSPP